MPSVSTMPEIDGIHANVARAQLFDKGFGHRINSCFGGAVDRGIRRSKGAGKRTDIDDAGASRAEMLCRFLRSEHQAQDVQVELLMVKMTTAYGGIRSRHR